MTKTKTDKAVLVNPRSGRSINIDQDVYDVISKAIFHELKKNRQMTWTELAKGVQTCIETQKIPFKGSVEWYAVSVRNDMESKGLIRKFRDKGRMLNELTK